jgi:PAS domain S-box-containing protein
LTGINDESLGLQAVREGIQDYLTKGQTDGRNIARAIRYAIERGHAEGELRELNAELRAANASLVEAGRAAVNLMDDALTARQRAEAANDELRGEIAERRRAEAALRESEDRYRNLFENAPDAIVVHRDGRILHANSTALQLVGADNLAQVTSRQVLDFFRPAERRLTAERTRQAIAGQRLPAREGRLLRLNGQEVAIEFHTAPIDPTGAIQTIIRDITARKQAEERIKAALREKEVLLKEIHHRVKNNLQVISSLVNLQADALQDPAVRNLFHDIRDRVRSMALVHERLYQSASLAEVDFADYSRSLLNYLWRAHSPAAVEVRMNLDVAPILFPVDTAVPCGLVLNELVSNALKHAFTGRPAGEIAVSLQRGPDGRVCLRVGDNGVGMPDGFDWRQTRSLGLQLVQMLAAQLSATVQVHSDAGAGTAFDLVFAVPSAPADSSTKPWQAA